jgi:hypothetical protein
MKGAGGFKRDPDAKGRLRYRCTTVQRYCAELRRQRLLPRSTADLVDVLVRIMLGGAPTTTVTPSREALADLMGCSVRTVSALVAKLERTDEQPLGVLDVDRDDPVRRGGSWTRRRCNRYTFLAPPAEQKPRSPAGATDCTRSESVPTDNHPDERAGPVDRGHGPPHRGPTELGRSIIRQIKEQRGIA